MTPSRSPRLATLLLVLAGMASCGKLPFIPIPDAGKTDAGILPTTDGGTMQPDGGLPVSMACAVLNERRCAYLARCGLIEDTLQSRTECVRGLEANWCGPLTWPPHVAKGVLRYDPARAESCAQAFTTRACADWATLPDSCNRFLLPRVPLGKDCYDGYEECTEGVCRGSSCPRTCQPRALLDEVCTVDSDCRTGLYCKFSTVMTTVGQCAVYGTLGAACETTRQCGEGLQCISQQCQLLPPVGLPCLAGRCADTAWCEGAGAGDAGVCMAKRVDGSPCEAGQCLPGSVCDPIRTICVRVELSSGDPCSLLQQCPKGQTCLGATAQRLGSCDAPLGLNATCATDLDCETHLACRSVSGALTCQPRASAGEPCGSTTTCQAGATCLDGTCTLLPLPGESCTATRACRWGLCRDLANADGGAVCGALLSAGQTCARNEECVSGVCNGTCVARCVP